MSEEEFSKANIKQRCITLLVLGLLATGLLGSRLFYLQILTHDKALKDQGDQILRKVRQPAYRGRIYTADGKLMADTVQKFSLEFYLPEYLQRGAKSNKVSAAEALNEVQYLSKSLNRKFNVSTHEIAQALDAYQDQYAAVPVLENVPSAMQGNIRKLIKIDGFPVWLELKRGRLALHPGKMAFDANAKDVYAELQHQMKATSGKKESPQILLSERQLSLALSARRAVAPLTLIRQLTLPQRQYLQIIELPIFAKLQGNQLLILPHKLRLSHAEGSRTRTAKAVHQRATEIAKRLQMEVPFSVKDVKKHIEKSAGLPFTGFSGLDSKDCARLNDLIGKTKLLEIVIDPERYYPFPFLYSQILGWATTRPMEKVSEDDKKDIDYYIQSLWGRRGLERTYDKELAGTGGQKIIEVNISGEEKYDSKASIVKDDEASAALHGQNLHLTLRNDAQQIAYDLMKEHRGAMVVVDVKTGEIIAMVSTPSYNLRTIRQDYGSVVKEDLNLAPQQWLDPMRNRALSATYMPGSIVKPLVALKALELGIITPDFTYECNGRYTDYNQSIHCTGHHGQVTMHRGLMSSCNEFYCHCGAKLGTKNLRDAFESAGFGEAQLRQRYSRYFSGEVIDDTTGNCGYLPHLKRDNKIGINSQLGIGQSKISISPLQAAMYAAALANEGKLMKPILIKEIRDSLNEASLWRAEPELSSRLPGNAEHLKLVQEGMRAVIHGNYATARAARERATQGIALAGKTGTAQVYYSPRDEEGNTMQDENGKTIRKKMLNTWFICFGPYKNPRYAAAILVQEGSSGGGTCAPIARKFFDQWLGTGENIKLK